MEENSLQNEQRASSRFDGVVRSKPEVLDNVTSNVDQLHVSLPVMVAERAKRRSSLDTPAFPQVEKCHRRYSVGSTFSKSFSRAKSSFEEDSMILQLLRRSSLGSISSNTVGWLRPTQEYQCSPNLDRRSSFGCESLMEYNVEDEEEEHSQQFFLSPEAILSLQYTDDVFLVKRDLEKKYHPRSCLVNQPQISAPLRCTVVNWLLKLNAKFEFTQETVFLAVHIFDRFLELSPIAYNCCQLLAVTTLSVASKMEESKGPSMSCLAKLCVGCSYQKHHFRRMEILVLTRLGFHLHAASSLHFINYFALKACQLGYLDRNVGKEARRAAELCLCDYEVTQYLPSVQAAAALLYAAQTLNPDMREELELLLELEVPASSDTIVESDQLMKYISGTNPSFKTIGENMSPEREACSKSNMCKTCLEENILFNFFDSKASPAAVGKLVNVFHFIFPEDEKKSIFKCCRRMNQVLKAFRGVPGVENGKMLIPASAPLCYSPKALGHAPVPSNSETQQSIERDNQQISILAENLHEEAETNIEAEALGFDKGRRDSGLPCEGV